MTNSLPHIQPPLERQATLSVPQNRKPEDGEGFAALLGKETARTDAVRASAGAAGEGGKADGAPGGESPRAGAPAATPAEEGAEARAPRPEVPGMPLHGRGVAVFQRAVMAGRSPSEVMQGRLFSEASQDIKRTQALEGLMEGMGVSDDSPLSSARNFNVARQLPGLSLSMRDQNVIRALSHDDYVRTHNASDAAAARARRRSARQRRGEGAQRGGEEIGSLSARFESGKAGISAIGYDSKGGTSYGKYQIASRVGTMDAFLSFLDNEAPDISRRLRDAGPANTGSRQGAMPDTWRDIASEQPERFGKLQESFIRESHYDPAVAGITERTRLNLDELSPIMREVIWSTAVQHGARGAVRIFEQADATSSGSGRTYERNLISRVYDIRSGQFGGHSADIQQSVHNRFREEESLALNMLEETRSRTA
ncbi:hypothetical protein [uncultured Desulfovibrio sp.]|uniref:VgrG-related protein n=1 Tax=uncultured Desulfovibrio sp. TaxID=167968 RepID=UPI002637F38F|nr:hypothetical protein [uncultured Desulfovibrio sp.]